MSAAPLVSFVLPAYNYARFLPDCLNSILGLRTEAGIEVVVVNDASTDDSPAVLARYTDPRVRVLHNDQNLGHARTVEVGLRAARGALIARIDPDDRYCPNFLDDTLPHFADPQIGLVYGDAVMIDETGRQIGLCRRPHGGRAWAGNDLVGLLQDNFICAPTVIARRECWLDALPVPAGLAFHDWYFTIQIARKWKFAYVPKALAEYRVHGAQHHVRVAADGSEERSVLWLLDRVYAEAESDAALQRAKVAARGRVYASHAVDAALKYFGAGNFSAARRSFLRALRHQPKLLVERRAAHLFLGTLLGRRLYDRIKSAGRRVLGSA